MDKPSAAAVRTFPTAQEDAEKEVVSPNARYEGPESAYRLAFTDVDFLLREELRPIRLQLELLKPELVQDEQGVEATIVFFGSARIVAREVEDAADHPLRTRVLDPPDRLRPAHRDGDDLARGRQAVSLRRDRRGSLGAARLRVRLRPAGRAGARHLVSGLGVNRLVSLIG